MTLADTFRTALESLRGNLLRTILTTLGIIIGVAAVIAMVAVGAGAERRVNELIQNLGSNILIVLNGAATSGGARGGAGTQPSLTIADARALQAESEAILIAAPSQRGSGQLVFGNVNWFTTIYGADTDYLTARDWVIDRGRAFTPTEERAAAKVVLVGQTVIDKLFAGGDPVGQTVRVNRVPFVVVGTLRTKGQTPFGSDQDDAIFIPLDTARKRVLGGRYAAGDYVASITVKAASAADVPAAERELAEILRQRHRIRPGQPDDFSVRNVSQMLEARAESSRTMGFLLAAVAGVSLLVGGIGIMNIMLVSVTERTREIGLRMAIGARGRDILLQFVIEAVTLSLLGGAIGVALGVGGSRLASQMAGWPMVIEPAAIVLAVGSSALIGVFFGFYPARKASRLDPIEALRRD